MFQLDHFRSAANQANKALHELRLVHSEEVGRREAAEAEALRWRQKAEAAEVLASGHQGGQGRRVSGDGSSPIGNLRQRFGWAREEQRPAAGTPAKRRPAPNSRFEDRSAGSGTGGGGGSGRRRENSRQEHTCPTRKMAPTGQRPPRSS
ncbi:unnamed protein product, partial [Ectocarpus sp. 12 AP-2014]